MSLPLILLKLLHEAVMFDGSNVEYKLQAESKCKISIRPEFTVS